jgi:transposase
MPRQTTAAVATLGIDIGKNVFHLSGLNERGAVVLRQRLSRGQVEARLANIAPCLVGMEACVGAHHLGRQLRALGHDVRLVAPGEVPEELGFRARVKAIADLAPLLRS